MLLPPKVFFTMARDASKGSGGITSYFLFHMRFHSFPSRQTSRRAPPRSAGLGTRPCRSDPRRTCLSHSPPILRPQLPTLVLLRHAHIRACITTTNVSGRRIFSLSKTRPFEHQTLARISVSSSICRAAFRTISITIKGDNKQCQNVNILRPTRLA